MRHVLPGAVVLSVILIANPASSDSLKVSPYQYGLLVNEVLEQVGSEMRFHRHSCTGHFSIGCRFSTEWIDMRVEGQVNPTSISKVLIGADLLQDKAGADPIQVVADCVMTLGATMVVMDPRLASERREQHLSDLMTEVLNTGASEDEGVDVNYTLVFDEAASGMLNITVTSLNSGPIDSLAGRDSFKSGAAGYKDGDHP